MFKERISLGVLGGVLGAGKATASKTRDDTKAWISSSFPNYSVTSLSSDHESQSL